MPTGYTAELMEKGVPFEKFVLQCARAFGALITLREESWDVPIPEFQVEKFYVENVANSLEELEKLLAMSETEKVKFGEKQKRAAIRSTEQYLENSRAENRRLLEMEEKVRAWRPPTKDHVGLKEFMLQQIDISKNTTDYSEDQLARDSAKPAMEFFLVSLRTARDSVRYSRKQLEEETKRVQERNQWVKNLKESLTQVPQ